MERQFQWMAGGQLVKMKKILIVIPARYESQRLPGKVLEKIHGYPMIYWVYKRAIASQSGEVVVAADHPKVFMALESLGIPYVETDTNCRNGTERVYEVTNLLLYFYLVKYDYFN